MAENNQRKIANPIDSIDDDDPFAELTRIMGFDPRVPISQQREAVAADEARPAVVTPIIAKAAAAPAPVAHDDFGIDLEKELLGGLGHFEPLNEPAAPAAPAPFAKLSEPAKAATYDKPAVAKAAYDEPAVPAAYDDPADTTAHDDAAAYDEPAIEAAYDEPVARTYYDAPAAKPSYEEPVAKAGYHEPVVYDAPVAKAVYDEPADAAADDEPFAAATYDAPVAKAAYREPVARYGYHEPVARAAYDAPAAKAAYQEPATTAAYDEPLAAIAHDDPATGPLYDESYATAADRESVVTSAHDEPVEFDALEAELAAAAEAMVDVDLLVEAPAEERDLHADEPAPFTQADAQDDLLDDAVAAEIEGRAAAHADDDFLSEFELEDLDVQHVSADAAPVEQRVVAEEIATDAELSEPVAETAPQPIDPMADVDMDFSAVFDREFAADAREDRGEVAESLADRAPARPERRAAELANAISVDDQLELTLEDELSALLDEDHARLQPEVPAVAAAAAAASRPQFLSDAHWSSPVAKQAASVESASRSGWAATPADAWAATAFDARRPLADPSLTGRHANYQLPSAPASAPAPRPGEDLDDLLDTMESEVHASDHDVAAVEEEHPAAQQPAPVSHTDRYDYGRTAVSEPPPAQLADDEAEVTAAVAGYGEAPEIETVDVPEAAVAMTDDLDIPELAYEEARQPAAYDDIDADFAADFNETATSEEPVNQAVRGVAHPTERADFDAEFEALYGPAYAQDGAAAETPADDRYHQPLAADGRREARNDEFDDFASDQLDVSDPHDRFVDLDFEGDPQEEMAPAGLVARQQAEQPRRRGLLIAAVVGGVALLGGVGAMALNFGGGDAPEVPVLVKAEDGPVKVKPDNPGGTTVPNVDNKVYDAVEGTAAAASAPAQPKLVTTAEEPVDIAALGQDDALPGVSGVEDIIAKSEDRIDPVVEEGPDQTPTESIAVAPRKVKTMVVRSDGTLVPREETATPASEAMPSEAPLAAGSEEDAATVVAAADDTPLVPAKPVKSTKITAESQTPASELPAKPVKSTKVTVDGQPEAAPVESALPPANADDEATAEAAPTAAAEPAEPVAAAPSEPAEPESQEVAAVAPEPTTVKTSPWSVQISSQPSADKAKTTYEDLAKRYASVIGGRGVNIVKAEVEGKGTFWRVRVPAQSRNDANALCNEYKAAGGSCFISK